MERLIVGDVTAESYRAAIEGSADYTILKLAVTGVYRHASSRVLAQRTAEALALAELAAMYGITEDSPLQPTLLELNSPRWRVPRLFRDAVDWLSERIEKALSVPVVYDFGKRPMARAPDIAAAVQLDTAARLRAKAEQGEQLELPLDATKAEMYALLKDLGAESAPAQSHPIIVEEVQSRFARSRETILSLDFYRAAYPYWRYSSVLDDRTTQGCRDLNGLTMPASDPRWLGFVPPRHWRCRAHVIAVIHSEGVHAKKTAPNLEHSGEGTFGTLNDEWEPRPASYPADLWEIYMGAKGAADPHIEIAGKWWRKNPTPDG